MSTLFKKPTLKSFKSASELFSRHRERSATLTPSVPENDVLHNDAHSTYSSASTGGRLRNMFRIGTNSQLSLNRGMELHLEKENSYSPSNKSTASTLVSTGSPGLGPHSGKNPNACK
jgi:hypothetical protein